MKAFLASVVAVVGIAVGASVILDSYQQTVDSRFVGSGARPDPEPKLRGKAGPNG
jgi:hypothetical protein